VRHDQLFPIWLSLRVALIALIAIAPAGLAIAWVQARRRYPLRSLVDAAILLPLVLPPSVVGFGLVYCLGERGLIGRVLPGRIIFTEAAAVIASAFVALPVLVKTAQPAFASVPDELEAVGRTLGLRPLALFFRVTLPLAWRGVVAALVLGFARALGEFGATLMFAGNVPGRTNTMPIEIFSAFRAGDDARALGYVGVLTIVSCVVVLLAGRWSSRP